MQTRDQQSEAAYFPPSDQDIGEIVRSGSIYDGDYDYDDQLGFLLQNPVNISPEVLINDLSGFDLPSSLPPPPENPCDHEDNRKDIHSSQLGKRIRKTRSRKEHNLKERLRRQKFKEKMKILEKMIPDCDKRDTASILDDAIKYINTLRYQVQMISMSGGHSMFHPPLMMMPPQPTIFPPPSLQARIPFDFPMSHIGLFNPYLPTTREVHSTFSNPFRLSNEQCLFENAGGDKGCGSGPTSWNI